MGYERQPPANPGISMLMSKALSLALVACCLLLGPAAQALPPTSREGEGLIQSVDGKSRTFVISFNDDSRRRRLLWNRNTEFVAGMTFTSSDALKAGLTVRVRYRAPLFGEPFATRVSVTNPRRQEHERQRDR